jgi:hypothetical protein
MARNFTKFLLTGLSVIALHSVVSSYSNNGGGVISGSAVAGCSCHGAADINTIVSILGIPAAYTAGQTYPVSVLVENTSMQGAGLNLSVSTGSISNLGAYLVNSTPQSIRHDGVNPMVSGIAEFTFDWVAPSTGSAPLVVNASANAVNLNGNTLGDGWNFATVSAPLSLNFLSFEVDTKPNAITLKWKTQEESKIKSFVVERSLDGISFDSISLILANGSSSVGRLYDYIDAPAYSNDYYYRVKVYDFNGGVSYTATKKAVFNNGAEMDFLLFPNPIAITNNLNVNVFNNLGNVLIANVYSQNGKLIYSMRHAAKKGTNYLSVLKKLPQGYYALEVIPENGKSIKKPFVVR